MNTEYSDPKHRSISNKHDEEAAVARTRIETSSDGEDLSGAENVAGFKPRVTAWSIKVAEKDLNLPAAASAFYSRPESVCDNDDRVRINSTTDFPYKCIAKLFITGQSSRWTGTGFFIGPRCVITNGHVVFPDRSWAREIQVVPGLNGSEGPFGTQTSSRFMSVRGWTEGSGDPDYDYGAVVLPDTTLYDRLRAHFGYQVNANPGTLNSAGYPGDKPVGTQWFNAGPVTRSSSRRFFYMIDTAGGQSGSPVWIRNGESRIAVGVHGYGGCPNSAIRCVEDVARNWADWCTK